MHVITATNVNQAYAIALRYLDNEGILEDSRNGPVLVAPGPVTTVYLQPQQRVLFSPLRNANPFFHFFEALWMLAGRNDLAFPKQFNKRFGEYSDNGVTLAGAYGYRWHNYFGYDQLEYVVKELHRDPASRRAVLCMYDASQYSDSERIPGDTIRLHDIGTKDLPCNTHAYVDLRGGRLNLTVCCRSNDIVWGCYGANAVHFSMLQEWLAAALGVPMGVYRQMSNNFHLYTSVVPRADIPKLADDAECMNLYNGGVAWPTQLVDVLPGVATPAAQWLAECGEFLSHQDTEEIYQPLFTNVALPMWHAWRAHKAGNYTAALQAAGSIAAQDWRLACTMWLQRRAAANQTRLATSSGPS